MNRIFAIAVRHITYAADVPLRSEYRVIPMRTLRRIQAASLRVAPQWFLCVFLGAYITMQVATSGSLVI